MRKFNSSTEWVNWVNEFKVKYNNITTGFDNFSTLRKYEIILISSIGSDRLEPLSESYLRILLKEVQKKYERINS